MMTKKKYTEILFEIFWNLQNDVICSSGQDGQGVAEIGEPWIWD